MEYGFGPCMCGDICCPYCGPAQGNVRCDLCCRWASDGGCVDPEACEKKEQEQLEEVEWEEIMEDMQGGDLYGPIIEQDLGAEGYNEE